jgi:hypothetical protein
MDHAEQLLKETVEQQVRKEKWTIPNKSWQLRKYLKGSSRYCQLFEHPGYYVSSLKWFSAFNM